jgi:O-antigen/teichoic acid export membrane protein
MTTVQDAARRNLTLTRYAVIGAFVTNAAVNVVLLGTLARLGGLETVGIWTFLGAVSLNVQILDLGLTNALTFHMSRDGLSASLPAIHRLVWISMGLGVVVAAAVSLFLVFGQMVPASVGLAVIAALCLLLSNWLITIRLSQHQQYWFNLKSILRVLTQASAAVFLFMNWSEQPALAFGGALLLGGIVELGGVLALTRRQMGQLSRGARLETLRELVSGFSLENASLRAYQPFAHMLVGHFLGVSALGVFAIAQRIPIVINQSVSEALRALLPSLAQLFRNKALEDSVQLVRDGVVTQIVLVVPAVAFVAAHAALILHVWIGEVRPDLVDFLRLLLAAIGIVCLSTPFYWANQASGGARQMGLVGVWRLVLVLGTGSILLLAGNGLEVFVLVFAVGQVLHSAAIVILAHRLSGVVLPVFSGIRWDRLLGFVAVAAILSYALTFIPLSSDVGRLLSSGALYAGTIGPLGLWALSRGYFRQGPNVFMGKAQQ